MSLITLPADLHSCDIPVPVCGDVRGCGSRLPHAAVLAVPGPEREGAGAHQPQRDGGHVLWRYAVPILTIFLHAA